MPTQTRKARLRRAYFALLADIGVPEAQRHAWQRMLVGKESSRSWTPAEFETAVAALQRFRGLHLDRRPHLRQHAGDAFITDSVNKGSYPHEKEP